MRDLLTTIYRYRGFIWSSVKRDFQARYQTSMLGALWLVLQPLSMILVYTLVFSEVMKARMPDNTGSFAYSIGLLYPSDVSLFPFCPDLVGSAI
ncbi:hypothetical protein ACI1VK_22940, partial [Escherichia coli]